MEAQTLNQLFVAACARHNKDDAILHKEGGEWKKLSSAAWLDAARDAAVGLSLRGVQQGDRVVLLSENRLEWFTIEAGLQILGAVTVPIYPTLTAQQAAYIIRDSGARVVIASSAEQQAKIAEVRDSLESVEMVFTLDAPAPGSGDQSWSRVTDAGTSSRRVDSGAAERLAAAVSGDDLATIIYTSGTTGNPKGVMLTQANLVQNTLVSHEALTLTPEDRAISVLPYSHVFARMVAHYLYPHAGVTIAIAESMDTLVQNIGEVHPTVMACVPRFYEKMRDKVLESAAAGSPLKQKIFHWAFSVGYAVGKHRQDGTSVPAGLKFKYGLATKLVFSKLHARMGGRMELFVSGGRRSPATSRSSSWRRAGW